MLIPTHVVEPVENIGQLITFVVKERGLNDADLLRVIELQRAQELTLSEALLQLGLLTPAELQRARQPQAAVALELRGAAPQSLLMVRDPFHQAVEQVRALRTDLLLRQPDKQHNRLVMVSGTRGDGRSTLAASLAIACAQLEQPTLLVDTDLRAPRLHELFGLPRGPGLSDTLERGVAPQVFAINGVPHLAVLTAGKAVSNPLEMLCSRPFADLMQSWRRSYRHVIVDTTAAERGADAMAVAMAAGGAVPIARLNHSLLAASTELIKRLRGAQVPLVGGVVLKGAL